MQIKDLLNKQYITPSLLRLLFPQAEDEYGEIIGSYDYPLVAFKAELLHSALVHAFVFARAIRSGKSLNEENYPFSFRSQIKNSWTLNAFSGPVTTPSNTFSSFLNNCLYVTPLLIKENSNKTISTIIQAIRIITEDDYTGYESPLNEETLLNFFDSLLLFKTTEIDYDRMQFIFRLNKDEEYEIDCQPFIYMLTDNQNKSSAKPSCYIATYVCKGKQIGELCINLRPLDGIINPPAKQIYCQASKNETIRMMFKALDLPTDWLAVQRNWCCDLEFMQKLANVAEDVLPKYWNLSRTEIKSKCVKDDFVALFYDSRIKNDILEKYKSPSKKLHIGNLDNILFGLFINHGIFKTMRDLFDESDNPSASTNSKRNMSHLFELFLDAFESQKYITADEKQHALDECNRKIDTHIFALRAKVHESSPRFQKRSLEIVAEWRAYTVLKLAGIRADNLFADKESIYSIDDYFNMIKKSSTSAQDGLNQVLALLIEIYGALIKNDLTTGHNDTANSTYIKEDQFYSDIYSLRQEIANYDLDARFQKFYEIVKKSENSVQVSKILGRESICDIDKLVDFRYDIKDNLHNEHKEVSDKNSEVSVDFSKKFIFVSYSHADRTEVERFVRHWKRLGYQVYIDNREMQGGDDWEEKAISAIKHKNCAMFSIFISKNSLLSLPVAQELLAAKERFQNGEIQYVLLDIAENEVATTIINLKNCTNNIEKRNALSVFVKNITDSLLYIFPSTLDKTNEYNNSLLQILGVPNKETDLIRDSEYTILEKTIAKFYTFLKYGVYTDNNIDEYFQGNAENSPSMKKCIYPIVASMKETKIHRDNITMVGYEMVTGNADSRDRTNYILTTRPLPNPDDYYCIPHQNRVGEDCSWMADPLLISYKRMMQK